MADIKIKDGLESEFKNWFSESNKILSELDGFVSRRLLKSSDGNHRIIAEHKSKDTFEKMHNSEEHATLHSTAITVMTEPPMPVFYNVLTG